MNQLKRFLLAGVATLGLLSPFAHGATIVLDDFDNYVADKMINQQTTSWTRFGVAFADGIYSIRDGVGGTRGASVIMQFDQAKGNTNGSMRYVYGSPASYEQGVTFSFDLGVNTLSPSTKVTLQVSDSTNSNIYEFTSTHSVASTSFENHSFTIDANTMRRVGGTGSLDAVLQDLKNVTIRFTNTGEDVKQNFSIDNFTVTYNAIPEPTAAFLVPAAGGLFLALRLRSRARKSS